MIKVKAVLALLIGFTVLVLPSTVAASDAHYLIGEMEKLRDSLKVDDPARIDLTLRLADLYFDVSIKEGGEGNHDVLRGNRLKALDLYRHSLNGTDGVQKAKGLTRLKIEFQMARLMSRLGEHEMAESHYLNVQRNKNVPKKMKEQASLALAEWYEEDGKYETSKKFYDVAISLCDVKASCNYAHYRKAWLFFKDTKLEEAITELKAALWVDKEGGEIREASLQDLIMFMSNLDTDGSKELEYIKSLSNQIKRPELVRKLVEAFYVAGNRRAGSNLLAYINELKPNLYYETRLLEEFYGFRKWEKVEKLLGSLEKRQSSDIPVKAEDAKEVKKIMRRYLVQVDSEAGVIPELMPFLKRSIDIYLTIYPNDDLRKKLQQGWLKAESDSMAKIDRLGKWITEDLAYKFKSSEIRKLRQTRLSLAQKLEKSQGKESKDRKKLSAILIEESLAIAEILKGTPEADEFEYVAARKYYEQKDYERALPLFKGLVDRGLGYNKITNWAVLSQNLTLDIFNNQKAYQSILDQVALWKAGTSGRTSKKIASENKTMDKIAIEASFEKAVAMKESPESLQKFYEFCFAGVFPKKSCANAKVLSVRFADQTKLVSLLEKEGDQEALMTEYELMGRFSEAAALQEKLVLKKAKRKATYEQYLKIALLYELDNNFKSRDRILKVMMKKMKKAKSLPKEWEGVLFLTLDEAGLIDSKALFLPWTTKRKLSLAARLEMTSSSKTTKKMIMSQNESIGPVWSKLILKKVEKPFESVSKIKFYGRSSRWLFKKRTKAIDRFVSLAKKHLEGSDLETRIYLLHMLTRTYSQMTEDILATPLPKDLDAETLGQVQGQLQAMSAPFEKVRADYQKLLDEQLVELTQKDKEKVVAVQANLEGAQKNYSNFIQLESPVSQKVAVSTLSEARDIKKSLLTKPSSRDALSNLLSFYEGKSSARLAAYYKGRISSLGEEVKEPSKEVVNEKE
jgi:hypothetical protein